MRLGLSKARHVLALSKNLKSRNECLPQLSKASSKSTRALPKRPEGYWP